MFNTEGGPARGRPFISIRDNRAALGFGLALAGRTSLAQSIAHDPGAFPHRPHDGASEPPPPVAELTAKTLRLRAVSFDPHCGHFCRSSDALIERTSCSNFPLHEEQVYS